MARRRRGDAAERGRVPSPDELLEIVHDRGGFASARELARDLGLRGGDKAELKRRLRSLSGDGGKRQPSMAVMEVVEIDTDGEVWAESKQLPGTAILVVSSRENRSAPAVGDRFLGRLERQDDGGLSASVFKILPATAKELVGVVEKAGAHWWLRPSSKQAKRELRLSQVPQGVASGDLVRAELTPGRPLAPPSAKIVERFGRVDEPAAVSMSVAAELGLPSVFPPQVLVEAERAKPIGAGARLDLRGMPLVTIDGEDARDFDDAVWAAPLAGGGFEAVVAIADVAHYVRPGGELDEEALKRGNSVYFPDRVLPMLPEVLSNGLCSLKPGEDRACLSCHMRFGERGELSKWKFNRSIMRSRARLTYEQVQAAHEGRLDDATAPLAQDVIEPLFGLFEMLLAARKRRGTIELEIPERRVEFAEDGTIASIRPRQRLESHMLIEEMMIAANVAAAKALESQKAACVYRVHDRPDALKIEGLAQYVGELGLTTSRNPKSQNDFNRLLASIDDLRLREQIAQLILRAQAQAVYSCENIGHFGLNLKSYAHFTSPIRRYSDLVLHRLLIAQLGLSEPESGAAVDEDRLAVVCERISACERKAVEAERKALARYVALFMADREGAEFPARIANVQRFGFFVSLDDTGAEGLVPVSSLGDERFEYVETRQVLIGERSAKAYSVGDALTVTLVECDIVKGMLLFSVASHEAGRPTRMAAKAARKRPGSSGRGRGFDRRRGSRRPGRGR